jgi:hypothetical protein
VRRGQAFAVDERDQAKSAVPIEWKKVPQHLLHETRRII